MSVAGKAARRGPALDRVRPLLSPRPSEARRRSPAILDAGLDPAQRSAVRLPAGRALLVLGEAGHGKTTVAVHRFAHVWRSTTTPLRASVIVPAEGLARLVQSLLRRLGADVEAQTYDAWARSEARRAFRDLPRRETELVAPSIASLKRDPALRVALAELASRRPGRINDDLDARPSRSRALAVRADLQHLFGDHALLDAVAAASDAITSRMIDDTLDHTRIQFSLRAEREWSHVTDKKRLRAVDGRSLDDGTSTAAAGTVDAEDYAVMFELDRMRALYAGLAPSPPRPHDLVLVDEAQELAPLELAMIGRSLAAGATLIVAGDADQQTDSTTRFPGWHAVMGELGRDDYATARLDIGYRCPPAVARLARVIRRPDVLPDDDGDEAAAAAFEPALPAGVVIVAFDEPRSLVVRIAQEVSALLRRDRNASIAVICRSPLFARFVTNALHGEQVPARLVFDGRFLARGPVQITTVEETKGLEFDVVIVPDATARDYPNDSPSRRALYVAVTRARHQVLLAHVGPPTPLLWPAATLV